MTVFELIGTAFSKVNSTYSYPRIYSYGQYVIVTDEFIETWELNIYRTNYDVYQLSNIPIIIQKEILLHLK
ncbi:MAG: hypothetical protein DRG78_00585 [Epsilonproteobacteria bacterium]|nr:MAG: hypothetical protein DRG78_00585 [Campylobacterota bacterium]